MASGPIETATGSIAGNGRTRNVGPMASRLGLLRHRRQPRCPARRNPPHVGPKQEPRPMAQTSNRLLDDLARLMTDAVGAAQGVGREVESVVKGQIERLLQDMNLANREEVEVLRDMVVAAREENEQAAIRMKALEDRLAALEGLPRGAGDTLPP